MPALRAHAPRANGRADLLPPGAATRVRGQEPDSPTMLAQQERGIPQISADRADRSPGARTARPAQGRRSTTHAARGSLARPLTPRRPHSLRLRPYSEWVSIRPTLRVGLLNRRLPYAGQVGTKCRIETRVSRACCAQRSRGVSAHLRAVALGSQVTREWPSPRNASEPAMIAAVVTDCRPASVSALCRAAKLPEKLKCCLGRRSGPWPRTPLAAPAEQETPSDTSGGQSSDASVKCRELTPFTCVFPCRTSAVTGRRREIVHYEFAGLRRSGSRRCSASIDASIWLWPLAFRAFRFRDSDDLPNPRFYSGVVMLFLGLLQNR